MSSETVPVDHAQSTCCQGQEDKCKDSPELPFKAGDVVFLKSGGSPMTIAAVREEAITGRPLANLVWEGEGDKLQEIILPQACLTRHGPRSVIEQRLEDSIAHMLSRFRVKV